MQETNFVSSLLPEILTVEVPVGWFLPTKLNLNLNPLTIPMAELCAIQALVESFDFIILAEDDGTGYTKFNL
jgi:hypothetical protein